MTRNNRQHPRVESDLRVNVRLRQGGQVKTGRIRNISLGGLFIEMEPLAFGAELELGITFPAAARAVTCTGYVVWSTKNEPDRAQGMAGNGIRLSDLSVADMRLLSEYVETHL